MNFCPKCGQLQGELAPHGSKYHPHCYPDGTDGTMGKHIKELYPPMTRIEATKRLIMVGMRLDVQERIRNQIPMPEIINAAMKRLTIRDLRTLYRLFRSYGNGRFVSAMKSVVAHSEALRRLGAVAYCRPGRGFRKGNP
jgi:hypothetical protein